MGQGGFITLVNGTPYDWLKTNQHSYQMNSWNFDHTIASGSAATMYVEWDQGIFIAQSDDGGEATYAFGGENQSFTVQARARNAFTLQIQFSNLSTPGNPIGSTLNLGWNHDGYVQFVLAGTSGSFLSSHSPASSWMQDHMNLLGTRSLRRLCMPGSHDAGMSIRTGGTPGGTDCNTLTQSKSILGQLQCGVRYFDIRPVIGDGLFTTGHYEKVDGIVFVSWQGANGQSIDSIVADVNSFTATNAELVILNLLHDLNTMVGNSDYRPFNQSEWDELFEKLSGINHLFKTATVDLTNLTLSEFIGSNRSAVVLIVRPDISLGSHANQGFYPSASFPLYDVYANTNDVGKMSSDQFAKMKVQRPNPDASCFLLSWTLTLDKTQVIPLVGKCIKDLANIANPLIYARLLPQCSAQTYPNILYIDNVLNTDIAALAMAVNQKV